MNVLEKRVENQVQFWSLLGPFLILLSIAVLLFKVSSHWYFPLSALIGIPLCVKWKIKGMAAALGCLLSFSVVGYLSIDLDEQFWHVGMALAMAFSFIVLTLSLEEVEGLVDKLQLESQSRLDNFLRLEEKLKTMEHTWFVEKESIQGQVISLTNDLTQIQDEKQTFYKLALLSKDELSHFKSEHDKLLQELFYKKQSIAQLNEKLHDSETHLQEYINTDSTSTISKLKQNISNLEEEKELIDSQFQELKKDHERLLEVFYKSQQNEKEYLKQCEDSQKEIESHQISIKNFHDQYQCLENEKNNIQSHLLSVQTQLEQTTFLIQQNESFIQVQTHKIQQLEQLLEQRENEIQLHAETKFSLQNQLVGEEILKKHCEDLKYKLEQLQTQHDQEKDILEQQHLVQQNQLRGQLNQLMQEIDDSNSQILNYQSQDEKIKKIQVQLQLSQELNQELEQDLEELRKKLLTYKQELDETNQHLIEIDLLKQSKLGLEQELDLMIEQLKQSQQEIDQLKTVEKQLILMTENNQLLEKTVDQLKKEFLELQEKTSSFQLTEQHKNFTEIQFRKMEGLYLQLRKQFQEKSMVLDKTRQELFLTQEKMTSLYKSIEEEQIFDFSENEKFLQKDLYILSVEYEKIISDYKVEIDEMSDLISILLKQC
ncbi:hypothetical protein [Candidatus Protochlamydia amoebophila]|uniref:hypothetical protein n=1 Tax=Candidatus Protochlamydia amoebophila TaxID=362787 RepID=UPI001BCA03F6|nr:hypothetical protein [Candidatus Protochlamydia amoebophila]